MGWAINLKKSLISLIKIQTPTGEHDLTQNSIVRSSSITSLPPVWKVMEEGIDGKCETLYDIAELPEYMLQELAPGLIEIEKCEGKKIFQILKTRNVDKCVERSAYRVGQPGKPVCTQPGNCDSMWERSSITRYIACGPTKENLELQVILNEGEIQQSLLAYNTENMVTGTKQIIKLVKATTSKTTLPQIQSPITLEDLYYVYPKIGQEGVIKTEERKELLQHFPLTERTGLSVVQVDEEILTKLSPVTLKQKIIKKLTKVVEDLKQVEKFEEKDVTQYILSITKVLSLLDTKDIKSLYEEIKSPSIPEEQKEIMQQLVLEMAVISGTSPAIMFIKEMIVSEKISPLRIGTIIASLPHYIQTPTVKLLEEIFEIIKSPVVTRYETLKSNALLSLSTESSAVLTPPLLLLNTSPIWLVSSNQPEVKLKEFLRSCLLVPLDMNQSFQFFCLILRERAHQLSKEWPFILWLHLPILKEKFFSLSTLLLCITHPRRDPSELQLFQFL